MAEQDLQTTAFPQLKSEQIEKLERCTGATPKRLQDGEVLFKVGERDFKFFIVKSGLVEILDQSGDMPRVLTIHRPGGFTGDVSHLTGNPALVTAIARGETEVLEITTTALREVLDRCLDLSDVILQAFIARRQLIRQPGNFTGLRVIGSRYSKDTFRIRDFLAKNRVPLTWLDIETESDVDTLLKQFHVTEDETPVVICGRMLMLRNPTNLELAEAIGIRQPLEHTVYDLAIVGAGPAGLAAAVYGASEGLNTVVLDRVAPGGQAGRSMRIENYLGFPVGLTGDELMGRAYLQARKFRASVNMPTPVIRLTFDNAYPVLELEGGESLVAKCLLIATGAEYRRLGVEGCDQLEGCGVYYAATPQEATTCEGSDVVVVGGGNSAGQASVFLTGRARKVFHLIRGDDLSKNMSSYLARRIEGTANIELLKNTTVTRLIGNGYLKAVEVTDSRTGQTRTLETPAVFSFIGADPRTDWLSDAIATDSKGFVLTGPALGQSSGWTARRQPFLLETSHPGVFAAGDVRSGSVKRVASAVGEGAMAVQFVHQYLSQM
jgi:thioredoxin reductase (NADPH)